MMKSLGLLLALLPVGAVNVMSGATAKLNFKLTEEQIAAKKLEFEKMYDSAEVEAAIKRNNLVIGKDGIKGLPNFSNCPPESGLPSSP